jgi:hypothetical protein
MRVKLLGALLWTITAVAQAQTGPANGATRPVPSAPVSAQSVQNDFVLSAERLLQAPFASSIQLPIDSAQSQNLRNFFRPTPTRKIDVLLIESGDYENEADLTEDTEISYGIAADQMFKAARDALARRYGKALKSAPKGLIQVDTSDPPAGEATSKEGQIFDDESWTPEYEGGAEFTNGDSGDSRFWRVGSQFLVLQRVRITGDGTFDEVVLITASPANESRGK